MSPLKAEFTSSLTSTYGAYVIPAIKITNLVAEHYPNLQPVLKNVTFSVMPNEKIAIIGRTGSGKTSLLQCITKLIEF